MHSWAAGHAQGLAHGVMRIRNHLTQCYHPEHPGQILTSLLVVQKGDFESLDFCFQGMPMRFTGLNNSLRIVHTNTTSQNKQVFAYLFCHG